MTKELLDKANSLNFEIESLKLRLKTAKTYHSDHLIDRNLLDECNKRISEHLEVKLIQKQKEFDELNEKTPNTTN